MDARPALTPLEPATLFSSAWWLEAAAPGAWGEVAIEEGGRFAARLAYTERRLPLVGTVLGQPPLTPYLGPELAPSVDPNDIEAQNRLCEALIEALPSHARFQQNFHPSLTNWMAFYWKGYQQHTRYTHCFEDVSDPAALWHGFSQRARQAVRRAEKLVGVEDATAEVLYELTLRSFAANGQRPGYGRDYLRRVAQAAIGRGQGRLRVARDAQGNPHAAVLIVWDSETAYYLVGGSDPDHRSSGAVSLLIWEALQLAAHTSRRFDFEGSMQPGIAFFFRSFRPRQTPYFRVSRSTAVASAATFAARHARRWRGAA